MVKTSDYRLREYPEAGSWLDRLLNKSTSPNDAETKIKEQVGEENFKVYKELVRVQQICGSVQARLPFEFFIHWPAIKSKGVFLHTYLILAPLKTKNQGSRLTTCHKTIISFGPCWPLQKPAFWQHSGAPRLFFSACFFL